MALLRAGREEVRRLQETEADLTRRVALASTSTHVKPDELRKSVHAVLAVTGVPTSARLVLEYFVLGARWAPAYQCRMSRDCRQADVQLRAMVCQKTGEDWSAVTLDLSTAAPMSWTDQALRPRSRASGRASGRAGGVRARVPSSPTVLP